MAEPTKYGLTKQESDRISRLLSVAQMEQEILDSITESYKNFVIGTVFKRNNVPPEKFPLSAVNLATGELIITEPEAPPAQPKKVEATGKPTP